MKLSEDTRRFLQPIKMFSQQNLLTLAQLVAKNNY